MKNPVERIRATFQEELRHWLGKGDVEPLSRWHRFLRFWGLVGRNFVENRCMVRASALAYTTLLALVPLLAVGISFATSFLKGERGHQQIQKAIDFILDKVAPQIGLVAKAGGDFDARTKAVEFINSAIQNISSGALGVTAVIALIFTAVSLLGSIESTLNDIWGVRYGRSWVSRIPQYFTAIALGGLLLMAMSLNAGPYFEATHELLNQMPIIGNLIYQLLPVLVLILVLGFFYQLMPNTRVQWRAAMAGGFCAGCMLHLNNIFSSIYFGQVVRNSKIYGSLGILPVLLIGLYLSWVIVLFGAQISYAFQNRRACHLNDQAEEVNQRGREFIALRLMTHIAERFQHGLAPASTLDLAEAIGVPTRLVQQVLEPLLQANLVVEVVGRERGYVPARPLASITFSDILQVMRHAQGKELSTREDSGRERVQSHFDRILNAEHEAARDITLEKLTNGRLDSTSTLNSLSA